MLPQSLQSHDLNFSCSGILSSLTLTLQVIFLGFKCLPCHFAFPDGGGVFSERTFLVTLLVRTTEVILMAHETVGGAKGMCSIYNLYTKTSLNRPISEAFHIPMCFCSSSIIAALIFLSDPLVNATECSKHNS